MADASDPVIQGIINQAVQEGILRYQRESRPGSNAPADGNRFDDGTVNPNNSAGRLTHKEVGYFDPSYPSTDDSPIANEHGSVFYRDVYVFVDRLEDLVSFKGEPTVRELVPSCLRGSALIWYTTELTDLEKRGLRNATVKEWCETLITTFKEQTSVALQNLQSERYTMADARKQVHPRSYVQKILRNAKAAQMTSVHNQLTLAWNNLDIEFKAQVPAPSPTTTISGFLNDLDAKASVWYEQARAKSAPRNTSQYGQQGTRGYSQQANTPRNPYYSNYRNNAYTPQWNKSGFQQANQGSQQPNRTSNQPRPQPQLRPLNAPEPRRQITAGYGNPERRSGFNNSNRRPWGERSRGEQYQPQQARPRVYYGDTAEDEEPVPDLGNEEQDAYYGENDDIEEEHHEEHGHFDEPEVHFTNPIDVPLHICRKCSASFSARNQLFRHLRSSCWKEVSTQPQVPLDAPEVAANHVSSEEPIHIVSASRPPKAKPGYAFRGFHYATVRVSVGGGTFDACADTGCPMTLFDRGKLLQLLPDIRLQRLASPIPVRGLGDTVHQTHEYANVSFLIEGELDGKPATAELSGEVHVVDKLRANMLMGNDMIVPHGIVLDPANHRMTIGECKNITARINAVARGTPLIQRTIRAGTTVTVPPNSTTSIPVVYHGSLPKDRDFLFEPKYYHDLGFEGGVYAHVVDASISFVQLRNATDHPARINRRTKLGNVIEYAQDGCYLASPEEAPLAAGGWLNRKPKQSWKSKIANAIAATSVWAASTAVNPATSTNVALTETPLPAAPVTINPALEHVMAGGITVYGKLQDAVRIATVAEEFPSIWIDRGQTVDIPEAEWMPIQLKEGADPKPSRVYPLGEKDRKVVDDTFHKLHEHGKMEWVSQPTKFSYPVFVVWRDTPNGRKGRVVVDIRGLNKITDSDNYPMPLQSDIISAVAGCGYISTIDATGYFHQFNVRRADRSKLTVVSHRGQEQYNVALMGYKGSPPYVQRQTDNMLRPFYDFARAYIDDIVVFSQTLDEHLEHLRKIFRLCEVRRITLSPNKSFLGYPTVTLLGQRVDSLGLSTSEEKIKAIQSLQFPKTLRDLEIYLGMTGWLRSSIRNYAQLSKPLQERKTLLTKELPTNSDGEQSKGTARKRQSVKAQLAEPTEEEQQAYENLQEAFRSPVFLVHFDPARRLYIDLDASKSWGFAAMIYHVKGDTGTDAPVARTSVEPILFLSKLLNDAERNYWPTELEVAGIVWVVKKVRHMIESSKCPPVVIYTDHSAAVPISRQTTLTTSSTDKLNLRLVRASQYLSSFNIAVRHKSGKSNTVPDALSRLQGHEQAHKDQPGVLDVLYGRPTEPLNAGPDLPPLPVITYHITLVEMSDDFKDRLKKAYREDTHWKKILDIIQPATAARANTATAPVKPSPAEGPPPTSEQPQPPNASAESLSQPLPAVPRSEGQSSGIRFKLRDGLIYYTSGDGRERLCIPEAMEGEVFNMAHDLANHGGFHRTYDRLSSSVYIRQLVKRLRNYIIHCPDCQVFQTVRHSPYGSLNPIVTPSIPFHTIAMDFVVELPSVDGFNVLLTMTCKFTKKIALEPGKDTWGAEEWAIIVVTALYKRDWGIPRSFITDRDPKFMSSFWRVVFQRLGVKMLTSTAYHPQTDGQSERTNQTVEIALRYCLSKPDSNWVESLPFISATMNNSINFSTGFAPNELLYGFKVNDNLGLLEDLPAEDYDRLRTIKRDAADEAIAFANAMSKTRYDKKHTALYLKEGSYAYLKLHHGYKIPGLTNRKLSQQRAGPFKVLEKVGNLAYRLQLPSTMRIHPVISVAQLEPCPQGDPYHRPRPDNPGPVENEDPSYPAFEIERLLDRKIVRNLPQYLVKWKGWDHSWNAYYPLRELALKAQELVDDYDSRNPFQEVEVHHRHRNRCIAGSTVAETRAPQATSDAQTPTPPGPPQVPPPRGRRGRPRKHPVLPTSS